MCDKGLTQSLGSRAWKLRCDGAGATTLRRMGRPALRLGFQRNSVDEPMRKRSWLLNLSIKTFLHTNAARP